MIEFAKLRRLTPKKAARIMAKCCECGVFNPARAETLLEKVRKGERAACPRKGSLRETAQFFPCPEGQIRSLDPTRGNLQESSRIFLTKEKDADMVFDHRCLFKGQKRG